jgi:urease accessory protein
VVIVHPPGGIAGGDELELNISAGEHAGVQLTTPGAGKWYRGFGRNARQTVRIGVAAGAMCEWLPQENIVFDGAAAQMSLQVDLADDAVFCGWDFTCLGRPQGDQLAVVSRTGVHRRSRSLSRGAVVPGRQLFLRYDAGGRKSGE